MNEIYTIVGGVTVWLLGGVGVLVCLALLAGVVWSTFAAFYGAKEWIALKAITKFSGMTLKERARLNRAAMRASHDLNLSTKNCHDLLKLVDALPAALKEVDELDSESAEHEARRNAERELERKQWETEYDH